MSASGTRRSSINTSSPQNFLDHWRETAKPPTTSLPAPPHCLSPPTGSTVDQRYDSSEPAADDV